jgi:hypothetical protein
MPDMSIASKLPEFALRMRCQRWWDGGKVVSGYLLTCLIGILTTSFNAGIDIMVIGSEP